MEQKFKKKYRDDFAGGCNLYLGIRQIADNESPDATNCDFKGKGGIGNRQGYTEIGEPATYTSGVKGMGELHTGSYHQAVAFISNGSAVVLAHSTDGGAWTNVTGTTFANIDIDVCQAGSYIFTGNGSDVMRHWSGSAWADTTNGTKGYFPTYYDKRIWVKDETNADTLNFSGQWASSSSKLGDFVDASAGTVTFKPGSGAEITGMAVFQDYLYVFLRDSIYRVSPASAANTFTVEQVTNSVGCIAPRSVVQVEEDIFFAADDGIYALGEVANYVSVRTTNKSGKIQEIFDGLSATNKKKLVGAYFNFKYHLFYSLFGSVNDSCTPYDVRYKGWQDWRNMSANDACVYEDSTGQQYLYFGHPTDSRVFKMYSGTTDDGAQIQSTFYTKSFDDDLPDILKVYLDHTFVFGAMNGDVTISVIFDDTETSATQSITQSRPQGGAGRDTAGRMPAGDATNTVTVTNYRGVPLRMRVNNKKFAVQYKVTSSGDWRLDNITTTYIPLDHYAFLSQYQIN